METRHGRSSWRGSAAVAALAIAALASGCQSAGHRPSRSALDRLQVEALDDANDGQPTTLDLVFVYDAGLLATLPTTSTSWFQNKDGWMLAAAGGAEVIQLDLPPTTSISDVKLPAHHRRAIRVLAFAQYQANLAPLADELSRRTCARIVLAAAAPHIEDCR